MTGQHSPSLLRGHGIVTCERGTVAAAHLDMVRGVSAIFVVLGHSRSLFFPDYADAGPLGWAGKLFYTVTGLGHQAVLVFFVLSGFFISASVYRKCRDGVWSWSSYGIDRGCRIYLVLVPGLLLTLSFDGLGLLLFGEHSVYQGTLCNVVPRPVEERVGPLIFLSNLFALQSGASPPLGSNGALWSLSNECWYYALFPLLVLSTFVPQRLWKRTASLLLVTVALCLLGWSHTFYFLIWLLGAGLPVLPQYLSGKRTLLRVASSLSILAFAGSLILVRQNVLAGFAGAELIPALAFSLVVYCVLHYRSPCSGTVYPRLAGLVAGFSFTLYVVHLPILVFCRACVPDAERWGLGPGSFALYMVIIALTLCIAALLAWVTEAKTEAVRKACLRLFRGPDRVGASARVQAVLLGADGSKASLAPSQKIPDSVGLEQRDTSSKTEQVCGPSPRISAPVRQ